MRPPAEVKPRAKELVSPTIPRNTGAATLRAVPTAPYELALLVALDQPELGECLMGSVCGPLHRQSIHSRLSRPGKYCRWRLSERRFRAMDHHESPLVYLAVFNRQMILWLWWYNGEQSHWGLKLKSPVQFFVGQNPNRCKMWWPNTRG